MASLELISGNGINVVFGINGINDIAIDTVDTTILGYQDGKLVSCDARSTQARRVFARRVSAFATSFLTNDGRVVYGNRRIDSVIHSMAIKCVDRALNPQSRGKTVSGIINGVYTPGELNVFKPNKNGKMILNTSNGKVSGINAATWSQRAQRGRYVPRHTIIENAEFVSHEMWSYCLELIDTVKAFPLAYDITTRKPVMWVYRFKLNGITRLVYPGDNFVTRILWAGASLATSEHRSKGRSGGRTINLPDDFDATEPIGQTCQHLLEVDIHELVGELYPTKRGTKNESAKDRGARQQYNAEQTAKQERGIKAHKAILKAYVALPEYNLTSLETRFLAEINKNYHCGNGYSIKPETVMNVPDTVLEDVFTDLNWARKIQYQFSRFDIGQRSPEKVVNKMIRECKYIAAFIEDVRGLTYSGIDTAKFKNGRTENIQISYIPPPNRLEEPYNMGTVRKAGPIEWHEDDQGLYRADPSGIYTVLDKYHPCFIGPMLLVYRPPRIRTHRKT